MSAPRPLSVLVVEDDFSIRRLLLERLLAHGLQAAGAADLGAAREALSRAPCDLLLLDLGLPDGDGVDFIRELRAWTDMPVLVLSARHLERDKIAALDAGADDYLSKPFASGELLARIRALTRRVRPERAGLPCECGELVIDFAAHRVTRAGVPVHLTAIEFRVLALLASHPGKVLTYRQLLAEAWGPGVQDQHHYVRIVVGHLRRKLEADVAQPRHLLTETGVGYRWQP
ncbi:MAG TPA: response regulator [Xanthomonadales bacterium]|nr:response regulator [Xanthomonadales bacterium]